MTQTPDAQSPETEIPETHTPETADPQARTPEATFTANRSLLVGVAYRLLGSVGDAEDVVQEAWLRWARVDTDTVADPTGFLVRTVTRLAIDRLRRWPRGGRPTSARGCPSPCSRAARRRRSVGDPADDAERASSVSLAMLVVLETLSPLERTVFVLHEAFAYSYAEIAEILDRSPAAVRQLAHRAREHVEARRPRFQTDAGDAPGGDRAVPARDPVRRPRRALDLLAPDAALWADGGGKSKAPLRPIHGADKIARFFVAIGVEALAPGQTVEITEVNGGPAAVLLGPAGPVAVLQVDLDDDRPGERRADDGQPGQAGRSRAAAPLRRDGRLTTEARTASDRSGRTSLRRRRPGAHHHTAPLRGRLEPGVDVGPAEHVQERAEKLQVHVADEGGVVAGQRVERTVHEDDGGALDPGLVALPGEHAGDVVERAHRRAARRPDPAARDRGGLPARPRRRGHRPVRPPRSRRRGSARRGRSAAPAR